LLLHTGVQNLGAVVQTVSEIFSKNQNILLTFTLNNSPVFVPLRTSVENELSWAWLYAIKISELYLLRALHL